MIKGVPTTEPTEPNEQPSIYGNLLYISPFTTHILQGFYTTPTYYATPPTYYPAQPTPELEKRTNGLWEQPGSSQD